ncbi:hypothetical protein CLV54_2103 [Compostimonas suwonensis]|uniref:Fibronectin type-III domain-containing protein n=1 Tax=Compostimonas suwonensis TaxID=1048394 RepID=A0A2M9BWK4_9MICO|nr:hypothetical protein CLV54_2103 [Compostimonas suwonensis]
MILGGSASSSALELNWEVDSFFGDSEAPERVLVSLNGRLFTNLDGDDTTVSIPAAAIGSLGSTVIAVGVSFWWSGSPPEELQSVFTFAIPGANNGGVFPAAPPSLSLVRNVPPTSNGPAVITISWRSNNYNDGNIFWGPTSNPRAFSRSIKPKGEIYSGEFPTDRPLSPGTAYSFRVEVRNTLHSTEWLASTLIVVAAVATPAAASWSVRARLLASGKPLTAGISAFVGPSRSVRTWLRG